MAEGGVAAALANTDPRDNWKVHFRDTMRGGKLLNNWRMAQLLAQEAPARVNELEAWGALFDRTPDGRILQRNFGGHQYPRLAHVGDRTGLEMIRTLQDKTVQQLNIDVYMECTVARLLKDGQRISGAFAYRRETGRFIVFRTKAVVLATGGIGRAYKINSNSWEYTGDGHALAYDAGADLIDMEFVQFHPTGMVWPLECAWHPGHRRRARRRRRAQELQGRAFHVPLHPGDVSQGLRRYGGGGQPLDRRCHRRPHAHSAAATRAAHSRCRGTRHHRGGACRAW